MAEKKKYCFGIDASIAVRKSVYWNDESWKVYKKKEEKESRKERMWWTRATKKKLPEQQQIFTTQTIKHWNDSSMFTQIMKSTESDARKYWTTVK